ncbi:MAG: calcium-binding protein [Cyanobacteria bacterium J06639_1]
MAFFSGTIAPDVLIGSHSATDGFFFAAGELSVVDIVQGGVDYGDFLQFTTPVSLDSTAFYGVTGIESIILHDEGYNEIELSSLPGIGGLTNSDTAGSAALNHLTIWGGDAGNTIDASTVLHFHVTLEIIGGSSDDSIFSGNGADILDGREGNDRIESGAGNDAVVGGSGRDTVLGSKGDDTIFGGQGNDELHGSGDNDELYGEDGEDWLNGGGGNDFLDGGNHNDTLYGDRGNDTLLGFDGIDYLYAGSGADSLNGGANNDILLGEGGQDIVEGGEGNDTLLGNGQSDTLLGDAGEDVLFGGNHNDYLTGGSDNDTMSGEGGQDTFFFERNSGHDVINDFVEGLGSQADIIDLTSFTEFEEIADLTMSFDGTNTTIEFDSDHSISLLGVDSSLLVSSNFIFA